MRSLMLSLFAVMVFTGCASGWEGMDYDQRQLYNTGFLFKPECEFDADGQPDRARCADYRLVNHKKHTPSWSDARLTTREGFFYKPTTPGPMPDVEIPDDLTIHWNSRVSKTEVDCFRLMKRTNPRPEFYPTACYDPILKEAHVTHGDWPALLHEIRHHREGRFHD